jgi:hypothetical protein
MLDEIVDRLLRKVFFATVHGSLVM